MSSTLLEQARGYHEHIERLEDYAKDVLIHETKTHKERLNNQHKVQMLIDELQTTASKLSALYADEDKSRSDEIKSMSGTGAAVFTSFYDRLKDIKEYHRKFPTLPLQRPEDLLPAETEVLVEFTGEEGYGRYLDLHDFYNRFLNLRIHKERKPAEELPYLSYLRTFSRFFDDPPDLKDEEYLNYLNDLIAYLEDFSSRANPLQDMERVLERIESEYGEAWEGGRRTWDKRPVVGPARAEEEAPADASEKSMTGKMSDMQVDKGDTVYCPHCMKSFKATVWEFHVKGKKHKQAVAKGANTDHLKEVFHAEYRVERLAGLLDDFVKATARNVEKKFTRTQAEWELGINDDEDEEESEDEDEEEVIVGIKNYPVGWDGKPIPYWMYRLHGLSVEYKCEICSNTSYFGPRAFEKHFQEWRHANGMRLLGIPNTAHFVNVTKQEDAKELWRRIKEQQDKSAWKPEAEEECEDADGNVYNRKTFEDLKRQGII